MARRSTTTGPCRQRSLPMPPKAPLPGASKDKPRRTPLATRAAPDATPEERRQLIAETAYFLAERRGFAEGGEMDDWLQAEAEIDRRLGGEGGSSS